MTLILDFHHNGQAITLAALTTATGLTRGGLDELLNLLVKRGLLIQTMERNVMGRGRARQFALSSFIFDSREPFLEAAGGRRTRAACEPVTGMRRLAAMPVPGEASTPIDKMPESRPHV